MTKNICVIYTETNGLHQLDEPVSKKNIFGFARLICLNYLIGYRKDNKFVKLKEVREILEPKCINFDKEAQKYHGISQEKAKKNGIDSKIIMNNFFEDLKNVKVIVSHNLPFHIRAIQTECYKTCTYINFSNYILIDTINFYHKFEFMNLKKLATKVLNKDYKDKKPKRYTRIIKDIFIKLYNEYESSIVSEKSSKK